MKIRGNTVGTTMPRSDLMQTDPRKADYVKGRDEFLKEVGAGASAYDVAVKNGFEGTEEEWLASLKGTAGPSGADGKDGATGVGIETIEIMEV